MTNADYPRFVGAAFKGLTTRHRNQLSNQAHNLAGADIKHRNNRAALW
jgi:hypothetical protein